VFILQRNLEPFGAEPEPDAADRAHLGKARKDGTDGGDDGLIRVEPDLAVGVTPDEADRQTAAELAACGLVANAAVEAGPQHMQLGLAHGALEPEQKAVVEQGRMVDAVGVADQGIGKAGKVDEAIPFGVVAGKP
jgi:hypothetical protein